SSCAAPDAIGLCCFFFSSRRRHTRFSRDWSSDVCSSDLAANYVQGNDRVGGLIGNMSGSGSASNRRARVYKSYSTGKVIGSTNRSEERRVGKECRSRRTGYGQQKAQR